MFLHRGHMCRLVVPHLVELSTTRLQKPAHPCSILFNLGRGGIDHREVGTKRDNHLLDSLLDCSQFSVNPIKKGRVVGLKILALLLCIGHVRAQVLVEALLVGPLTLVDIGNKQVEVLCDHTLDVLIIWHRHG